MAIDRTEEPITHGGSNRRYQFCRCSRCEKIERCTPMSDFYTLGQDNRGPLYCSACFKDIVFSKAK